MTSPTAFSGRSARSLEDRYSQCRNVLEAQGQSHVLAWWDSLDDDSRSHLLSEIESISWDVVTPLIESHVLNKPAEARLDCLEPAPVFPRIPDGNEASKYEQARSIGEKLISTGKVAAFTVAGGQGTRLGFDGPKGAMPITPLRDKTLFQVFAEMIQAFHARHDVIIPWYIMTSPSNHQHTVGFFEDHDFFGLSKNDVVLFSQGALPAFDFQGKLLMADKDRLALSPDGHGGSLKAMVASGALQDMQDRGVEIVSYFQVDNPLVQPFDELFIGLHRVNESEMSAKVTPKVHDLEKVGNVCLVDGRVAVVEYSNLPDELARAKNADGTRRFDAGNLGIHLFDVGFIDRIVGHQFQLPYHRAEKRVTWIDESGFQQTPSMQSPNAIKLESFVFDALPMARKTLLLEVDRQEEFSPVKNAEGADSVKTACRDQIRRAVRWLEAAGAEVPYKANGEPDVVVEIASSYALNSQDVQRNAKCPKKLTPGEKVYLS